MPVYNAGGHLCESVDSLLTQTFRDFELLIIDDASTDDSWEQIGAFSDPRIQALRNTKNIGLPATLNAGLRLARGEFIARQDQDDTSQPDRLQAQVDYFDAHPEVAILGTDAILINDDGKYCGRWRTPGDAALVRMALCFDNCLPHSSVMMRASIVRDRFGGYREVHACEDYDLWSRVAAEHPVRTLRRPLVHYRLHESSMMGIENSAKKKLSLSTREAIMRNNLAAHAPGLEKNEINAVITAWLHPENADMDCYASALEKMLSSWSEQVNAETNGALSLLAGQQYNLAYRMRADRRRFARLLWLLGRSLPAIAIRLPWFRLAVAAVRS